MELIRVEVDITQVGAPLMVVFKKSCSVGTSSDVARECLRTLELVRAAKEAMRR